MVYLEKLKLDIVALSGMEKSDCGVLYEDSMERTREVISQNNGRDSSGCWIKSGFMIC